jgi:hypothetical protein
MGTTWTWRHDLDGRRSRAVVVACVAAYAFYVTLAGKFWGYHYLPLAFFLSVASAWCLEPSRAPVHTSRPIALTVFFAVAVVVQLRIVERAPAAVRALTAPPPSSLQHERAITIARWLTAHARPTDTVQPLDWTGGAVDGMLIARVPIATKFVYDYEFYHHISSPLIRAYRRDFIEELQHAAPRFVIEVQDNKPWVTGVDTTRSFPELDGYIQAHYQVVSEQWGYRILERVR